jgi:hypothetical protein
MKTHGSYIENNTRHEGKLLFWGEWEPPSFVKKLIIPETALPGEKYPQYLHTPRLPLTDTIKKYQDGKHQNSDPFVFGKKFKYSICRQSIAKLRNLADGSLIIFGSRVNFRFVIDTIFVVKGSCPYDNPNAACFNDDEIYREIVIKMACGPDDRITVPNTLYTGATFDDDFYGMYSFVPAKPADDNVKVGFPRIALPSGFYKTAMSKYFSRWKVLEDGKIYEGKNMGVKMTDASIPEIKEFWEYIKNVVSDKYVLGFNFDMPKIN